MKKTICFIIIGVFAIGIGFFIGKLFLKPKGQKDYISKNISNEVKINTVKNNKVEEISTSAYEEKISANAEIIEETYYNECNHQIDYTLKKTDEYVNMTEDEIQKEFPTWEIKEFSPERVVLYKEEDDFCNEHFLVKDEEGFVTIYTIDNNEDVLELLDKTDIATKYLTQADRENLEKGMVVYTEKNLNKLIEDFE